jgi:hypothetical protein
MGTPGSLPIRLTAVPDRWVRPTRNPADLSVGLSDLSVGLSDLTCGPEDENTAWRASQGSPDVLR